MRDFIKRLAMAFYRFDITRNGRGQYLLIFKKPFHEWVALPERYLSKTNVLSLIKEIKRTGIPY